MAEAQRGSHEVRSAIAAGRSSALVKRWGCATFLLLNTFVPNALQAQVANDQPRERREIPIPRFSHMTVQPLPATIEARWERFDAGFGLHDEQSSLVAGSLLRAKYAADVAF